MTLLALSQACVQNLGVSFYFQTFFYISLMSSFSNFLTSSRLVRFFRLTALAAMLGHLGAISLKNLPYPRQYDATLDLAAMHVLYLVKSVNF